MLIESELLPQELQIDVINAVTKNMKEGNEDDKEFKRRLDLADRLLKERQIANDEQRKASNAPKENAQKERQQTLSKLQILQRRIRKHYKGSQDDEESQQKGHEVQ